MIRWKFLTLSRKKKIMFLLMLLLLLLVATINTRYKVLKMIDKNSFMYFNQTEKESEIITNNLYKTQLLNLTEINDLIPTAIKTMQSTKQKNTLAKEMEILSHIIFDSVEKNDAIVYTTVIIISSHVNYRNRRNMIRESWGNSNNWITNEKYLVVFFVARITDAKATIQMADESKVQKDIVFVDIIEDFYLLTKKVIIELMWAKKNVKFKTLLKGDDDTFINIDNIINFVKSIDITDGYFGNVIYNGRVKRYGRYGMSKIEFENDYYHPYCSGGGFILTNSSVYKMTSIFDLNKVFRIDDAYVGEIAFQAGITARHQRGFYMNNGICKYFKETCVTHPADNPGCNSFLLSRSLINNGKLPRNLRLENYACSDKNVC
ncbi:N-acetyllactosaminide beta-1,3-N-acetylglucosaminyltransferase 4 isoform X2 [Hydra vulgaris]|uniref:Hexosyltransferase n=1 Tax=Hydra vulgaris TaxID=6087 RepID=A0ABM4BGT4_HYDVU